MDKTYSPKDIEQKCYSEWEKNAYFKPNYQGEAYCIMIPPPNVTGSLHMGHGFQDSIMDALIRFQRMDGKNTLWQVGTDHAGISTQMVVERILAEQNVTRHDLGREKFVERVWDWKNESGNLITKQLRRMGASVDWERERFTMDDDLSNAVQEVFIRLYDEGLIYRGKKLVNWDPHFRTAISDLEVIATEEEGHLWHLRYPLSDDSSYLIVATTRPETMLGDTAVAVHPDDERYQHLIGKMIKLPLTNREIPIIADEYVDKEFGTGCVKITPAHDFNDYDMGQRHQLPLINIFTVDAKINDNAPAAYQGLDRFDARKKIVADLTELNLLEKIVPHKLNVPRAERGNTVVEPYLTDQWFVKMTDLVKPAIQAVEQGETKFIPETWTKTYFQWLHNIQDWCISRQLWWGHRIPAFYDAENNIYVGSDEQQVREKYKLSATTPLRQDEDVLDTWFSSALWPFATLGWPNNHEDLQTFYPTSVLVTGFDIIFFWVARMMIMGLKFMGQVPFREVYITGLIRDSEGQKMSKTKGNVLDPIDLIDGVDLETLVVKRTKGLMLTSMKDRIEKTTRKEFPNGIPASGTDALRFTFCALATTGRDIRFDLSRLEGYRNFCNKIWNAARYVLMNIGDFDANNTQIELSIFDHWITSRLQQTTEKIRNYFQQYRFDLIAQTIYEFVWNEYCDWYLELSKPILNSADSSAAQINGTRKTLVSVLENILLLLHPIMPFITEEIWQQIKNYTGKQAENTIMLQAYPKVATQLIDHELEAEIEWLKNFIIAIRNIRGEMNISPAKQLVILLHKGNEQDKKRVEKYHMFLLALAKLEQIEWLNNSSEAPPSATALAGDLEVLIPLAGLIDKEAEIKRLNKELEKLSLELAKIQGRLNNANYLEKAPAEVVNKERDRVVEMEAAKAKLSEKLVEIAGL